MPRMLATAPELLCSSLAEASPTPLRHAPPSPGSGLKARDESCAYQRRSLRARGETLCRMLSATRPIAPTRLESLNSFAPLIDSKCQLIEEEAQREKKRAKTRGDTPQPGLAQTPPQQRPAVTLIGVPGCVFNDKQSTRQHMLKMGSSRGLLPT
ncbi:uncharacterized protein TrAtP1_003787 [Trichoderma atroviride]|uniref:uncharacterized protein n=1 Tax=Hypocrea atroviridis TaxID=63577 RepID=UPI003323EDA5|nr:hypothetical protein TrAtP1_003787 [Trichoderma atroviride]